MTSLLTELARAKAIFQLRGICAAMGIDPLPINSGTEEAGSAAGVDPTGSGGAPRPQCGEDLLDHETELNGFPHLESNI